MFEHGTNHKILYEQKGDNIRTLRKENEKSGYHHMIKLYILNANRGSLLFLH